MSYLPEVPQLPSSRYAGALLGAACGFALLAQAPLFWTRVVLWLLCAACGVAGFVLLSKSRESAERPASPPARPAPAALKTASVASDDLVNVKAADGIGYLEERPAWFVRVVHPARFKEVEHDVHFKVFFFPTSSLIAVLLRFFDNPDNPYCFHRVFDLADVPTRQYLERLVAEKQWVVVVNSRGTEEGFSREVGIDEDGLPRTLEDAQRHLSGLRSVNGRTAVDDFLRVFKAEGEKGGFQAGWKAVDEWLNRRA